MKTEPTHTPSLTALYFLTVYTHTDIYMFIHTCNLPRVRADVKNDLQLPDILAIW